MEVAETIRLAVDSLRIPHEGAPRRFLTVSVGVATMTSHKDHPDLRAFFQAADAALYNAKASGRDQTVFQTKRRGKLARENLP